MEPATPHQACAAARRGRYRALAHGPLGSDQHRAEAQAQTILCIDESGLSPLPSVVRPDAPVGQPPIIREGSTRAHLAAIRAISPGGTRYVHRQNHPVNAGDVVGFLENLRREGPGRMVIIWDGAPMHRSHVTQPFLARGAAQRLHLERLPAYAPERNPGEGLWQQLKGVALRHGCGINIPHLTHAVQTSPKLTLLVNA